MFLIDNILVDERVIATPFLCDTARCKGACCTVKGGQGAPLLDEEIPDLERSVKAASRYLTEKSNAAIAARGAFEGEPGAYTTQCIDDADCVFVFYEGDVAKCSIEKAYFEGQSDFRKPLSCHLFPIRIADFHGPYLYYDEFDECAPALERGAKTNTRIPEAVREALIRAFGEEWYAKLALEAQKRKKQA
jgi:hypothetical protein